MLPAAAGSTTPAADTRGVTIRAARVPVGKYSCSAFDLPTLQSSFTAVRLCQLCVLLYRACACSVAALQRVGVQLARLRGVCTRRITGATSLGSGSTYEGGITSCHVTARAGESQRLSTDIDIVCVQTNPSSSRLTFSQ